jgi:nucleoside-diphosphate-sugar epimerase
VKVAVTGAGGYVGSRITRHLTASGHDVLALTSDQHGSRRPASAPFRLGQSLPHGVLDGVDVVVHAAHDFTAMGQDVARMNVDGSLPLLDAVAAKGVTLVLISTLSAFTGCASLYGKAKLALEAEVLERGGAVLRAGVVMAEGAGGIAGTLGRVTHALPVVPMPAANARLAVTDEEALTRLVAAMAAGDPCGRQRPVLAASDELSDLRSIVVALAGSHSLRILPVAARPVRAVLRGMELVGLRPPLRSDSLVALTHPIPLDQLAQLDPSPVRFPPLRELDMRSN